VERAIALAVDPGPGFRLGLGGRTRGLGPQQPLGTRGHDESEGGGVVI
jgi:hypothetical protein